MITNSKTSAPFVPTDKLEMLALELFNGALPKLPVDGVKRRCQLAKEFSGAHLSVPGVSKPDAKTHAALAPAFRAIAASRQARVDAFIAALTPPLTVNALRDKLVIALGEQALQAKLFSCRHTVACALVLLDALEGRDTKLDLLTNHVADGGKQFLAKLDAAFGAGVSAKLLPRGPLQIGALNTLLDGLSDALAETKTGTRFATPAAKPATTPAATVPKPSTVESLAAAIRAEADPATRARLYQQFTTLSEKH